MISCDFCDKEMPLRQARAIPVIKLGENEYCWCGRSECRKKLMVELNTILESSEHRVRASLYEPDKKEEKKND